MKKIVYFLLLVNLPYLIIGLGLVLLLTVPHLLYTIFSKDDKPDIKNYDMNDMVEWLHAHPVFKFVMDAPMIIKFLISASLWWWLFK